MEPEEPVDTSEDRAQNAASKLLAYINKQTAKLKHKDFNEYLEKNWDKIISLSCSKNRISSEELISALIDLL